MAGSAPVGWSGHDDGLAKAALVEAHRQGSRIGTRRRIGKRPRGAIIGEAFAEGVPRKDIFVASKFGYQTGPSGHCTTRFSCASNASIAA